MVMELAAKIHRPEKQHRRSDTTSTVPGKSLIEWDNATDIEADERHGLSEKKAFRPDN